MKTIEVALPDALAEKIEQVAHERGVSVEDLIAASVTEKLERDGAFDEAASHVLAKNAELYGRLA